MDPPSGANAESNSDPVESGLRSFLVIHERCRPVMYQVSEVKMPGAVKGCEPSGPGFRTRIHSGGGGRPRLHIRAQPLLSPGQPLPGRNAVGPGRTWGSFRGWGGGAPGSLPEGR